MRSDHDNKQPNGCSSFYFFRLLVFFVSCLLEDKLREYEYVPSPYCGCCKQTNRCHYVLVDFWIFRMVLFTLFLSLCLSFYLQFLSLCFGVNFPCLYVYVCISMFLLWYFCFSVVLSKIIPCLLILLLNLKLPNSNQYTLSLFCRESSK